MDREIFRDILDGRLPDGTQLGRKIGDEIEHRPGYDLTFSAPKSVSIAAEVGGDERLLDAHETAVKTALDWIETNAAVTRQRGLLGLREVNTGNLVIALFQHDTSREQDPQLLTHAVVANATEREDGRWVSIEARRSTTSRWRVGTCIEQPLPRKCSDSATR